jgi:hypothetical protein
MNAIAAQILGCERCRSAPASDSDLLLESIRSLYDDSQEGYSLCRCRECAQVYLEEFHEIIDWAGGEDDLWLRWTPLTADEVAEVEVLFPNETDDYADVPRLTAIMHRRGRLTRDPEGSYYWLEDGWDPGDLLPPG